MKRVILRCTLDGLLLHAHIDPGHGRLVAFDGDESFAMEAVEAAYYELVSATPDEMHDLRQARYRFLRTADDFQITAYSEAE
jgi:hypothetical protein